MISIQRVVCFLIPSQRLWGQKRHNSLDKYHSQPQTLETFKNCGNEYHKRVRRNCVRCHIFFVVYIKKGQGTKGCENTTTFAKDQFGKRILEWLNPNMYMSDFVRHFYLQYHSCKSMYELTDLNIKGMRVNMGIPNINFMLSN